MTRYGHIAWRVVAVVAFAGTAALAVTLTRAPARSDNANLSANLSQNPCVTSGLDAWLGLGATGSPHVTGNVDRIQASGTVYTLEFTNVSARACSLYGYPEVSAYAGTAAAGIQIGSSAVRDMSVRPHPVTLAPRATAHAVLRIGTSQFQTTACAQVTAPELRVLLPGAGMRAQPQYVQIRVPACSKKGPEFLTVQPIQPEPGIPGVTPP
ncbi:MAG: DUF4232 domain-containing protein [Streptosporangiaceae bacterium]